MRFHVVALPHTNVSLEHTSCAFNQKVLKFVKKMTSLGHWVHLCSSEIHDTPCSQHTTCITEQERIDCLEGNHYTKASFDYTKPHWIKFNDNAIQAIKKDLQPEDFICVIGGLAHKQIADAFPQHITVEFGIGYSGTFSNYRVFESYAWMHTVYGEQQKAQSARGKWFDAVIPASFNVNEFEFNDHKQDYYLYIGRLVEDKGIYLVSDLCKKLGKKLIVAGPGTPPPYGEYVGEVDTKKRSGLMSKATATFVPSYYLEPFGSVAVESQLCGTPVITTDWGAFTETVEQGKTGYRCRVYKDFVDATEAVKQLDFQHIRDRAISLYDLNVVRYQYQDYFQKLLTLHNEGWYQL